MRYHLIAWSARPDLLTEFALSQNTNYYYFVFIYFCLDDDPPTLTGCPDAFAVWVGSATETALIRWTPPVATDNVGLAGPATPNIPLNSRLSPPGATVVYTAVDTAGQMDTCEFMVTVSVATTGTLAYM